jgi:hypothetical protein
MDYPITDLYSIKTSISIGDKSKRINHYIADRFAPAKLSLLEAKIEEITNVYQWLYPEPDSKSENP